MADDPGSPDESLVYCLFGAFEKATLKAAQQHYYLVEFADDNSQRWASVCELMLRSQPLPTPLDAGSSVLAESENGYRHATLLDAIEAGYTGAEVRARRNIVSTLADTAAKLVEEFMELQSEHAAVHRKTVARRVEIAVGDGVSAEEKERVVEQCLVRAPNPILDNPSQLSVRNSLC